MELRKDYVLDRYVIIAEKRRERPREFKKEEDAKSDKPCFFCPGNESTTPAETGRTGGKKWEMRWFPNRFPAVEPAGSPVIRTDNEFYTFSDAYGHHEIIVDTPEHEKQLWDLNNGELEKLFGVYASRIHALGSKPDIKYVAIFKNHGREGGTSIVHSHSQVIAYNKVPGLVREEVNASSTHSGCAYCKIIEGEKESQRKVFNGNHIVCFTPYASRFNYEAWIFPKRHLRGIGDFNKEEMKELASVMKLVLSKLKRINCAYNYFLHYAPFGEDLHFHIAVCPRIAAWAGFEFLSNTVINSVSPESAAEYYRA